MDAAPQIRDEADAVAWVLARTGPEDGDDAAIVRIGGGVACISSDSSVEGVHVPLGAAPDVLGRRAAARALSDLAAMGALPVGLTCAVHVPAGRWQDAVAALAGVQDRGDQQGAALLGGDFTSTSGPLALVVTVLGRRAGGSPRAFVTRAGARAGDLLCVTGTIGARGLPEPPDRLRAGVALAPFARAMIDVSDGLARDARALARSSGCGLHIDLDAVPLAPALGDVVDAVGRGDDYELLVALDPHRLDAARRGLSVACPELALTRIGQLTDAPSEHEFLLGGAPVQVGVGFLHG